MAFNGYVQTTYGQFLLDLRDNVSSVTGWSVVDQDTSSSDGWVRFDPPAAWEDCHVVVNTDGYDGSADIYTGDPSTFDATDQVFDTRYTIKFLGIKANGESDSVIYWMQYDADGFAFTLQRTEDDTDDEVMAGAVELIDGFFNWSLADYPGAPPHVASGGDPGSAFEPDSNIYFDELTDSALEYISETQEYQIIGELLTDANDSFGGRDPIVGQTWKLLNESSGSNVNDRDTANDIYKILKYPNLPSPAQSWGIRMD